MIGGKKGEFPQFLELDMVNSDSSSDVAITNAVAVGRSLSTVT